MGRVLLLWVVLACGAGPGVSSAQGAPCQVGDERGFGGTGRGDERGFGGTGRQAGVFGTLTGFGSLCVNGLRIDYDARTPVVRDGVPDDPASLRRGQTVLVEATRAEQGLVARRISVEPALTGPVTGLLGPDRLEVMGESTGLPASLPADGRIDVRSLSVGDRVSVHGLRTTAGGIAVTRLERASAERPAAVAGRVGPTGAREVEVGRTRVSGLAAQPGAAVRVIGRWDPEAAALVVDRSRPALDFGRDIRLASVETRVTRTIDARIETPLLEIDASRVTEALDAIDTGARIWADGRLTPTGRLLADAIRIEPEGAGAPQPPGPIGLEDDPGSLAPTGREADRTGPEAGGADERVDRLDMAGDDADAQEDDREELEDEPEAPEVEREELEALDEEEWRLDPRDFLEDVDDFLDRRAADRDVRDDLEDLDGFEPGTDDDFDDGIAEGIDGDDDLDDDLFDDLDDDLFDDLDDDLDDDFDD